LQKARLSLAKALASRAKPATLPLIATGQTMARAHSPTSETAASAPLKKPDLLDQLATRSGLKKRDAKLALDATLTLIGEALARGDDLLLPPLGRVRVVKAKDLGAGAQLLTLKLRSGKDASQSGKTGLATAAEDV
jgi:hypothetical protein